MVLHTSHLGAIVWRVKFKAVAETLLLNLVPQMSDDRRPIMFVLVDKMDEWQAVDCIAVPPRCAGQYGLPEGPAAGIQVVVTAKSVSLEAYAALQAFPGMTVPYLSKLWSELKVKTKSSRPTTEPALLRGLVSHCLPQLTAEQVENIVKLRKLKPSREPTDTLLLDAAVISSAGKHMDEDMHQEFEKYAKSRNVQLSGVHADTTAGGSSGSGTVRTGLGQATKISLVGAKTPEWAKDFLPKNVPGCGIKKDDVRHMRWQTHYPCDVPPFSWSKSWGFMCTDGESLNYVLTAVWSAHTKKTGEACPYEFSF